MSETVKDKVIIGEKVSTKGTVDYAEGAEYSERLSNHSSDFSQWYTDEQILHFMKKLGYENRTLYDIPEDVAYILKKMPELTLEDSFKILKDSIIYFKDDENIPHDQYEEWKRLVDLEDLDSKEGIDEYDSFDIRAFASAIKFHSPYQEVRAVVDPEDDPTIPVETFRAYFLAIIWSVIGSGFNEFFFHRVVSISLGTPIIQMFLYICGKAWAKTIPCWTITIRGRKYGINIDKPWTQKEQMFSTLLYAICQGTFYTHYNILTQKLFYHSAFSFGYQFLLSLSVQFIGFGFAGILRKFVVYPARALWPTVMPTIAINKALLGKEKHESGMSRYKFFFLTFFIMFIYNWFPTYIINILNTFNWMTWIKPSNINLANITGGVTGLGINPISSFDWNVISYNSPLVYPFWSYLTQYLGCILAALIVIAVYYSNYMSCQYLPIFTNSLYTNTGDSFEVTEILDSGNKLDVKKYQSYSPPYYSAGNLVTYGAFICAYPLMITWSFIVHSKLLFNAFKDWALNLWAMRKLKSWATMFKSDYRALDDYDDPHSNAMKNYKEVPDWWYFAILIGSLVVGIAVVEHYPTNTPVWGLFVSLGFNFVFLIPTTILQATTGYSFGLNLLIEMVMGYALPGNPIAIMILKAFGYNIDGQADNYVSNLKIAHYCKIPPMALFRGQCVIVLIQIFVNLGVLNWQISNIKDFCTPHQNAKFTCPDAVTYYNASVVWGAIGPKRIFNHIYPIFKWCWLIGACIGIFFGVWKRWGKFYPRYFDPMLFVGGMVNMSPPYNLMYYTSGMIVSYISQYYMKRHHLNLWEKYNYVLSAGFSTGLVLSAIIIFFAVQYKDTAFNWWGNTVPYAGADGVGYPLKNITDTANGYFGYAPGHYP
ncbi:ANM_collapsed_G0059280.mRNA.1.CDS.1 [Saccharomyces cerevisiae]|nr:ANM_collapsed_G0059280.mRNA.1.CDS.1 [Saccharomyces cerevisiae]